MSLLDTRDDESVEADFGMLAAVSEYSSNGGGLSLSSASPLASDAGAEHALSHIDGPDSVPEELYWYALEQATQDPHPPASDRPPAELAAMHLVPEAEERGAWRERGEGGDALERASVSEIMSRDVLTVSPSASLKEAQELLAHSALRQVPVVENDRVVGILAANDLLRLAPALGGAPTGNGRLRARHLMRSPAVTVREHSSLQAAARIVCESELDALPVVDGERRLVGLLTSSDLIRALCSLRG